MSPVYKFLLGGKQKSSGNLLDVRFPYDDSLVARVHLAGKDDIMAAVAIAEKAFEKTRNMTSFERANALKFVAQSIQESRDDFAKTIIMETGKPVRDSYAEVDRAISTFTIAAEEAKRIGGEVLPLDITPAGAKRLAITKRFPSGPVVGITPFNFPLNLVAHKVGPAMAAGCSIVIKPASKTPLSALKLGEIITKSGWPPEAISVLPCTSANAQFLVTDERVKVLSFTGSADIGWKLKQQAGKKRVILELGGNGAAIVDEDADLNWAVSRIRFGAFYYSGQNCISVQRIYVHERNYDSFVRKLVAETKRMKVGDPRKKDVEMGPMIDAENVERVESWIEEAVAAGARVIYRGKRVGRVLHPTILTNVPVNAKVCTQEAFGPVKVVESFKKFSDAIVRVNNSQYGLQTGVFTKNIENMTVAFHELNVGGVIINDIPTFRVDNMPYGGVKDSGFGREGLKYAIDEMTEIKLMVLQV